MPRLVTEYEEEDARARYVAIITVDRPFCGLCPPEQKKRAVFLDRLRQRPLCAPCAVDLKAKQR